MENKRLPKSVFPMYYNANINIQNRAIDLRKNETEAEKLLWNKLKRKQVSGYKFRRQHPIEHFIVDFYCHEVKLVIELDGEIHDIAENKEYDTNRTFEIEKYGIKIIRFKNERIYENIDNVINEIKQTIEMRKQEFDK